MEVNFKNPNRLEIVKELFIRFNENYGNLFDIEAVNKALAGVILVNDDYSNITDKEVINELKRGAKAVQGEDRIYLTAKATIDTIYHEVLHQLTAEKCGVYYLLITSYIKEDLEKKAEAMGIRMFIRRDEQLNESFTRFMTELAIPEVTVNDAYQYGAFVIRKYYDSLIEKEIDPFFVLEAYAKGNQEAFNRFKDSFGNNFDEVLRNIEMANNKGYYIFKKIPNTIISNEAMLAIIDEATNNMTLH